MSREGLRTGLDPRTYIAGPTRNVSRLVSGFLQRAARRRLCSRPAGGGLPDRRTEVCRPVFERAPCSMHQLPQSITRESGATHQLSKAKSRLETSCLYSVVPFLIRVPSRSFAAQMVSPDLGRE